MLNRLALKNLKKNKTIMAIVFILIMLSVVLAITGMSIMFQLVSSIDTLFQQSKTPHFVQMHSGSIDEEEITLFSTTNPHVKEQQIVPLTLIGSEKIHYQGKDSGTINSVMDHYFTTQNETFDFLLDLHNEPVSVAQGEIAVPIYFMQEEGLSIGDLVDVVLNDTTSMKFTITAFVRDAQMNPSLVHSKRFILHEEDFEQMKQFGELEYLIEFRLTDVEDLSKFKVDYEQANLPIQGPTIDIHLFKTLNALTDGMIILLIFLASALICAISLLCIRFTMISSFEEDKQEIGIMKALGIAARNIRRLYLIKYSIVVGSAVFIGYVLSYLFVAIFTKDLLMYTGASENTYIHHALLFIIACILFGFIILFCLWMIRNLNKITPMTVLKPTEVKSRSTSSQLWKLNRGMNVHVFLALRDLRVRFKSYLLLLTIYAAAIFILLVPLHFLHTMQSEGFINYMGVEKSDIRIDLGANEDEESLLQKLIVAIRNDSEIDEYAYYETKKYTLIDEKGESEHLLMKTGDFSKFPLEYIAGEAPVDDYEIALSYLNSKELGKSVGDRLMIGTDNDEKQMVVTGVYQDITNGGLTAKGVKSFTNGKAFSHQISLNVTPGIDPTNKMKELHELFPTAKITDIKEYVSQTLGKTIHQLSILVFSLFAIVLGITAFITVLFFSLLIIQDESQTIIQRSLGFLLKGIKIRYVVTNIILVAMALILGTLMALYIGPYIMSVLLSFMGIAKIDFTIHPIMSFVLFPALFSMIMLFSVWVSTYSIKSFTISKIP